MTNLVPREAISAFVSGEEKQALALLERARAAVTGEQKAQLERLCGLVLIHMLREVEGTFLIERADAVLDELGAAKPQLDWLE